MEEKETNKQEDVVTSKEPWQEVAADRTPLDKRLIKACRHKSEMRWYRGMVIINLLIVIGVITVFICSIQSNKSYVDAYISKSIEVFNEQIEEENGEETTTYKQAEEELEDMVEDFPLNIQFFMEIIILIAFIPLLVCWLYAQYRSMSIKITKVNYPEIYEIVEEYAQKLQMKKIPEVYMVQGNGIINALSSFIPGKQYIEIMADLLEVAYREHHDMATIRFIIAHEMAHIYYKHSTLHNCYSILFSSVIPILSPTLSRAREYSCDRLAQVLSGSDGVDAMFMLIAGIHLYKQIDRDDYLEHSKNIKGFFVFCYNLICDHPIMNKRIAALMMKKGSGKLY